jgi:hypothetical protein
MWQHGKWWNKRTNIGLACDTKTIMIIQEKNVIIVYTSKVLHGLPGSGCSSTIPVVCKRCIRQSITEWCTPICPATLLLIKPACDMPTACHISSKVYYCLTIIQQWKHSIRKTLQPQLAKTICVIRYLFTSFNRTQLFSNDGDGKSSGCNLENISNLYTFRQKLSTTWLISQISFLKINFSKMWLL